MPASESIPNLSRIRLLVLDVDGVLTDGRIGIGAQGIEMKYFCVRDGLGIRLAQKAGIEVAFLSGRRSDAVLQRARELEVKQVILGSRDKVGDWERILRETPAEPSEAACMGDDLHDLALFGRAAFSAAPADAASEVRSAADYVCTLGGGKGAVREVIELILRTSGKWEGFVEGFHA